GTSFGVRRGSRQDRSAHLDLPAGRVRVDASILEQIAWARLRAGATGGAAPTAAGAGGALCIRCAELLVRLFRQARVRRAIGARNTVLGAAAGRPALGT